MLGENFLHFQNNLVLTSWDKRLALDKVSIYLGIVRAKGR